MNIQRINVQTPNRYNNSQKTDDGKNINFEGKFGDKISDFTAKIYGRYIANSEKIRVFAEKASKNGKVGDISTHFQVAGSLITSSAYMASTMKNKDFDKDNARTLAINQGLCFVVPTIGAYVTDHYISDIKKQVEYKYDAIHERKIAKAKMSPAERKEAMAKLGKQLKAVRTLLGILTFTLIYRYITPVVVTPFANKIGSWVNNMCHKNEEEKTAALQAPLTTQTADKVNNAT